MSALLALMASVMWGASDFLGGTASRRLSTSQVLFLSQLLTLPVAVAVFVLEHGWTCTAADVGWAAAAGVGGIIGLAGLYRALALGHMSLVAPISACGAAAPVLVGLVRGEHVPGAAIGGIGCVLLGVVVASVPDRNTDERAATSWTAVLLALVSACAFGGVLVCLANGGRSSPAMAMLVMRVTSVALVGGFAARSCVRLPRSAIRPSLVAIGLFDLAANGCYALASQHGELTVVGALGSMYPVVTVLLARQIDGERLGSLRRIGVLATLAGVVVIGAAQGGT